QSALVSEKVITLTKNDGILPVNDRNIKIAVIGPTGNSPLLFNGTYTFSDRYESEMMISLGKRPTMEGVNVTVNHAQDKKDLTQAEAKISSQTDDLIRREHGGVKTVYEALKEIYPNTEYAKGCDISSEGERGFKDAVETARKANIVVLTVGGKNGWNYTCTSGEGIDSQNITLPGKQAALIQRVFSVNKRMIIVHTDNKPLVEPWVYDHVPAIIEGWLPGIYGGNAIALVIAGIINPGGKLPVDVPRTVGQQPVYYYQHRGCRSEWTVKMDKLITSGGNASQLPFGYGLSYTTFEYSNGRLSTETGQDGVPVISIHISATNTGTLKGDEVVQVYGIDEIATIVRPQKELIGFKRVTLLPGEIRNVCFMFRLDQMAFINSQNQWVIEKGVFSFFIGRGANDKVFSTEYFQEQTLVIDHTKRGFFANAV
ncbi:MAG: glycoside hydrolase family 3 C-terminal domain-containing protein, partial [Treponema sp.]|nr:glycoside hydrolase family 3 C-terminal domain-containing protein [Treponema sp.]